MARQTYWLWFSAWLQLAGIGLAGWFYSWPAALALFLVLWGQNCRAKADDFQSIKLP